MWKRTQAWRLENGEYVFIASSHHSGWNRRWTDSYCIIMGESCKRRGQLLCFSLQSLLGGRDAYSFSEAINNDREASWKQFNSIWFAKFVQDLKPFRDWRRSNCDMGGLSIAAMFFWHLRCNDYRYLYACTQHKRPFGDKTREVDDNFMTFSEKKAISSILRLKHHVRIQLQSILQYNLW